MCWRLVEILAGTLDEGARDLFFGSHSIIENARMRDSVRLWLS